MGSDSIGNDGFVDAVRDFSGVLSMESASSRLVPTILLPMEPTISSEFKCTWASPLLDIMVDQ
jgi:hypothetical protein